MKNHIPMKHVLPILKQAFLLVSLIAIGFVHQASGQCQFTTATNGVDGTTTFQGNSVEYVAVNIDLDNNCEAFFSFSSISTTFSTGCNYIEYYDASGSVIATEDRTVMPGDPSFPSSTFKFTTDNIDGKSMARAGSFFFVRAKSSAEANDYTAYKGILINTVRDGVGPTLTIPTDKDLKCDSGDFSPTITGTATATDACGTIAELTFFDFDNLAQRGQPYLGGAICKQIIRTWRATDNSGNNTSDGQSILVWDDKRPVYKSMTENGKVITPAVVSDIIAYTDFEGNPSTIIYDDYYEYPAVVVDCENASTLFTPTGVSFLPSAEDNCGIIGGSAAVGFVDERNLNANPVQASFYNYTVQRWWRVFDECGLVSYARRDYEVRDTKSPTIDTNNSVYKGLRPVLNENLGNGDQSKVYEVTQLIREEGCAVNFIPTPTVFDNCANAAYLAATYQVEEYGANNSLTLIESGSYQIGQAIQLAGGAKYLVKLRFSDPVGNVTTLNMNVEVDFRNITVNCDSDPFEATILDNQGTTVNFLDLVDLNAIIQASDDVVDCVGDVTVYVRMQRLSPANSPVDSTDNFLLTINSLNFIAAVGTEDLPMVMFNCSDIGVTTDVLTELVDASTGQVLANCVRGVTGVKGENQEVAASFAVTPASAGMSDGSINFIITNPSFTQQYNVTWMGPVSGNAIDISSNYTIENLPDGTYTISIESSLYCEPTSFTIEVGTKTPLQLRYICPDDVMPGSPTVIQLEIAESFDNITALDFDIVVSGVPNAIVASATPIGFPDDVATISNNNTVISFSWTGASRDLSVGQRIFSFVVDIPASATVGSDLDVTLLNGTVEQLTNMGVRVNVPLQISNMCAIFVGENTDVSNGNLTLGGKVEFMNKGIPLEGITVTLMEGNNPRTTATNAAGEYSFDGIMAGADVTVSFTKTGNADAIDLGDVNFAQRMVSSLSPSGVSNLTSQTQIIAADVVTNKNVSLQDGVGIINSFLGDVVGFEEEWVFVEKSAIENMTLSYQFTMLDENMFTFENMTASMTDFNVLAIKKGDINATAIDEADANTGIENRNTNTLIIESEAPLQSGTTQTLVIKSGATMDLSALHLMMDFTDIEIIDIENLLDGANMVAHTTDNKLPILLLANEDQTIAANTALVRLVVKVNQSVNRLSEVVRLDRSNVAWNKTYSVENGLSNLDLKGKQISVTESFSLIQVLPNPFQTTTTIQFELADEDEVELTVWNAAGQVVLQKVKTAQAGFNEWKVRQEELKTAGLYFFSVRSSHDQATGKLILLD